ncbi:hypothetical protein DSM104329_02313 [Capillimicrobium parvum]|uniref:Uncharacterized protein n=1 Tax=Capillimicrobium parvum TaxID=2884022 RepID=A0A9E6XY20_9ACTN|nr:hypothetical protein DSM104329_02313 [Capillimicrobium parvum]
MTAGEDRRTGTGGPPDGGPPAARIAQPAVAVAGLFLEEVV